MQHLRGRGEGSKGSYGDASASCEPGCTSAVDHRPIHLAADTSMGVILHRRACSVSLPVAHRPIHLAADTSMGVILHRRACSVSLPVDACQ